MTKTPDFFGGPTPSDPSIPGPHTAVPPRPAADPTDPWAHIEAPSVAPPAAPQQLAAPPAADWAAAPTQQQPPAGVDPLPGADLDDDADDGRLLRRKSTHSSTSRGWRRWVSKLTGGRINPGPSAKQERADALVNQIRASLVDVHKVAFVSFKGGVGKSTMTVGVGSAISRIRGDRVISVDVNTDMGTLSARFGEDGGPKANIEHLAALQNSERYSNVRVHTVQNKDRLELLGAQNDPRSSYALGSRDYVTAMNILELHYNVILLDYGTSITAPLFDTIANDVTGLVVVAAQNVPGYRGALTTLQWLQAHGFGRLLEHTVVALNATQPGPALIDLDITEAKFRDIVADVIRIPYDPHLAQGLAVDFDSLKPKTRKALMTLAGAVAQHYPTRLPARHRASGEL